LFATIANIAGIQILEINDSKNFKELLSDPNNSNNKRNYIYVEKSNLDYTIRNSTHKYMHFEDGSEKIFNLITDPFELINLLHPNRLPLSNENEVIKEELISKLNEIRQ